ncbi:unnamed protein product [Euphydryas editha]|uniref:Uncharacterized protein n=1 Tax=Euphydryas editha TaxID=104508 RepID=A0AAU9U199_EUPED|nr:unnamed protein product [Euphydryas editha]
MFEARHEIPLIPKSRAVFSERIATTAARGGRADERREQTYKLMSVTPRDKAARIRRVRDVFSSEVKNKIF